MPSPLRNPADLSDIERRQIEMITETASQTEWCVVLGVLGGYSNEEDHPEELHKGAVSNMRKYCNHLQYPSLTDATKIKYATTTELITHVPFANSRGFRAFTCFVFGSSGAKNIWDILVMSGGTPAIRLLVPPLIKSGRIDNEDMLVMTRYAYQPPCSVDRNEEAQLELESDDLSRPEMMLRVSGIDRPISTGTAPDLDGISDDPDAYVTWLFEIHCVDFAAAAINAIMASRSNRLKNFKKRWLKWMEEEWKACETDRGKLESMPVWDGEPSDLAATFRTRSTKATLEQARWLYWNWERITPRRKLAVEFNAVWPIGSRKVGTVRAMDLSEQNSAAKTCREWRKYYEMESGLGDLEAEPLPK